MLLVDLVQLGPRGVELVGDALGLGVVKGGADLVNLGLLGVNGGLLSSERLDRLAGLLEVGDLGKSTLLVDESEATRVDRLLEGPVVVREREISVASKVGLGGKDEFDSLDLVVHISRGLERNLGLGSLEVLDLLSYTSNQLSSAVPSIRLRKSAPKLLTFLPTLSCISLTWSRVFPLPPLILACSPLNESSSARRATLRSW